MEIETIAARGRRPRFRRASEPPAFRLTEDDIVTVRQLARHRFLRSTHIAALIGRSLDRTNDRLCKLFHSGYLDRPRAQLDFYPTAGSAPIVYALADAGVRLLIERYGMAFANVEWSRKNREAGRPFIEHQLEVIDFQIGLQSAARDRGDLCVVHAEEIVAAFPNRTRNPFELRANVSHKGTRREIGLVPDVVFGLCFADGSRRFFLVEIDRGTMPISRSDIMQTSLERKMRTYLAAHAAKEHERRFGWKSFRVLVVTTDEQRMQSMIKILGALHVPRSIGASLFLFATRDQLVAADPLTLV
jgi:hypothetical protein